jgi:CIC family chloride channel protein
VFFGVEIILQELSVDALFTVMISAMVADVTARQFLGGGRFLTGFPTGITLPRATDYLLVAMLAVVAALAGLAFKTVLYKAEDVCDRVWGHRPEWARPAVGGVLLGVLLLAVPQLYGVGYPVMYQAVGGHYVLWFLLLLTAGKMVATSLTIGIGGSGGVFAHHRSSAPPPGWPSVNSRTIRWARPRATRRCTRRSRWARCSPPPYAPRGRRWPAWWR